MSDGNERDADPHERRGLIIGAILLVIVFAVGAAHLWQRNAKKPIPQTTPTKTLLTDCTGWIVSLPYAAQGDYSPILITKEGNQLGAFMACRVRSQGTKYVVTFHSKDGKTLEAELSHQDTEPMGMVAGGEIPAIPPGEWTVTFEIDGKTVAQTWFVVMAEGQGNGQ